MTAGLHLRLLAAALALALATQAWVSSQPNGASAAPPSGPPETEPDAVLPLTKDPCTFEGDDPYEKRIYKLEGWKGPDFERYPGACERLRFAYGPIVVEPGKNNVLIEPITIQSPRRDGYMTRFEPNLVLADGTIPPVDEVHLHHGTWLTDGATVNPVAGSAGFADLGPFIAAGEEKTIGTAPTGYGMPIEATDQWFLLYMVHSAITKPMVAYITYDIDFIPQRKAEKLGIEPVYSAWLDVRPSAYPVFNVQRKFGGRDGKCTWPSERCAAFDPFGKELTGQGRPGNGVGTDIQLPERGDRDPHVLVARAVGGVVGGVDPDLVVGLDPDPPVGQAGPGHREVP